MALQRTHARRSTPAWLAAMIYAGALVAVALIYFVLAKLGLQLASINPSASPIWPPTGFALAAVLLFGPRIWPAIYVGAFAANATTAGTLETSAIIALGNTLEGLFGGALINHWSGGRKTFDTPARVAKFVLVSAGPATVISASIGVLTLALAGFAPWEKFAPIWTTWWLGDVAGALVVTPVIVLWAESARRRFDYREWSDSVAVLGSAAAVGVVAFSPLLPRSEYTSPLGFLAILPLFWAALRRGPRDTATVGLILAIFAVWATVQHAGPFGQIGLDESFLLLLTFMISVSVPSLALSADVAMRRASEENLLRTRAELDSRVKERTAELADANIQLTEAQRLANLGSWSWDIVANRITWSDQLLDIYGLTRAEFGGAINDFLRYIHPDDRVPVGASISAALKSGTSFAHDERIVRPDGEIRYLQSVGEVVRDDNGTALRMLGVCLDVTDRKKAESALRESEQNYQFLLKGVRDYAIYRLDTEGHVRSWSESAQRIKGYAPEEIVGRHVSAFLPSEARDADLADQILMTAAREGQFKGESWLVRKDGSRFYGSIVLDAIRNERRRSGRLCQTGARRDPAVRGANRARQCARADGAGAEDGGARPTHRRHRPRFQQSPDDRVRLRADSVEPPDRQQGHAGSAGDPRRRRARRKAHPATARLLAPPATDAGRGRSARPHRSGTRHAGHVIARQYRAGCRCRRQGLAGRS